MSYFVHTKSGGSKSFHSFAEAENYAKSVYPDARPQKDGDEGVLGHGQGKAFDPAVKISEEEENPFLSKPEPEGDE